MGMLLGLLVVLVLVAVVALGASTARRASVERARLARERELAPVRRLAFEDVTALGVELQHLDAELAGQPLDEGARADYQRALDTYDDAKRAADAIAAPDDVRHVTSVLDDGRYAIACVQARVAGHALPVRRPPCFFDPRHGLSVADVSWAPTGGAPRHVPACALDAERVRAGAEPDVRQVMVGPRRVPYWQGGRAYQPYAAGYFASWGPMDWLLAGFMFDAFGGFDLLGGVGEGLGDAIGGIGEGFGDAIGGIGEGIGDLFDGFDF